MNPERSDFDPRPNDPGVDPRLTEPGMDPRPTGTLPNQDCGADCEQALVELELFLDGELPEGEIGRISQHLAACYPCTDRATFEEQLRAIVRRGCVDAAPADLIERIRATLDAGALPGATHGGD